VLERGWPPGLTKQCATSVEMFPVRFCVVDNSGSMITMDCQRLVPHEGTMKAIRASRWAELRDVVNDMGAAAVQLQAETHFHFLNPTSSGQFFCVADQGEGLVGRAGAPTDLRTLKEAMDTSPTGSTPLTQAVQLLIQLIHPAADKLRAHGQQAVVILATDGLPNDPSTFLHALQQLQMLPVWLVVRLCTNEDAVVDYWSDLDAQLEAPLEVLDDVTGEAKEIHGKNPWLTYAPSLHLARTFGLQDKLFDLLDEQSLPPSQAKQFIERLLGCDELPEPEIDAAAFVTAVRAALAHLPKVYNPMTRSMAPWIDVGALQRHVKRNGAGSSRAGGCVLM